MSHVKFKKRVCHSVDFRGSRAIHLLVSVIQAEITRNQKPGKLGGEFHSNMAVHEQSLSALVD